MKLYEHPEYMVDEKPKRKKKKQEIELPLWVHIFRALFIFAIVLGLSLVGVKANAGPKNNCTREYKRMLHAHTLGNMSKYKYYRDIYYICRDMQDIRTDERIEQEMRDKASRHNKRGQKPDIIEDLEQRRDTVNDWFDWLWD